MDTRSYRWTLALVGSLAVSLAVSASSPAETPTPAPPTVTSRVADTGQDRCFGERNQAIDCDDEPRGQDGAYRGSAPHYTDNGDGTITDDVTGLVWQEGVGSLYGQEPVVITETGPAPLSERPFRQQGARG